jgi:F-type H+-transporting ATPase subunit epsilon
MATFPLLIGTPDGVLFDGKVERVMCRSITGDLAILAGHANYCTALGMGEAYVVLEDGTKKTAACIGGMLSVMNGECHLLATTWEWADDIDKERAETAREKAEERLKNEKLSARDQRIVEAKLRRSLVRLGVKG